MLAVWDSRVVAGRFIKLNLGSGVTTAGSTSGAGRRGGQLPVNQGVDLGELCCWIVRVLVCWGGSRAQTQLQCVFVHPSVIIWCITRY